MTGIRRLRCRPPAGGPTRAVVVALALAALVSGACGIQHDEQARTLPSDKVPFGLLATSTTTTTTQRPEAPAVPTSVYLVDNETGQLVEVQRSVSAPPSVRTALQELLEGPTERELDQGLRSNIASATELLGIIGPENGVVTIDLSDLTGPTGEGQRLALAQIVYTVTAQPQVDRVLFRFQGELKEVPNAAGESTGEPLSRSDFAPFDPAATTTSAPPPPPPEG
ncbi:MAG: GerMN domain-containing protein [Actinobacteria bacterium]|nr:GerMN domain-containing protein [Actinomycetota bacterium]